MPKDQNRDGGQSGNHPFAGGFSPGSSMCAIPNFFRAVCRPDPAEGKDVEVFQGHCSIRLFRNRPRSQCGKVASWAANSRTGFAHGKNTLLMAALPELPLEAPPHSKTSRR